MVLSAKGAGMGDRIWVMGIHIGVGEFNPIGLRGKVITDGRWLVPLVRKGFLRWLGNKDFR